MRQYFVNEILSDDAQIILGAEISHHLRDVLRCKENDKIRLVDANNNLFLASIHLSATNVIAQVQQRLMNQEENKEIIYCACMIKKDKWEWLIQKAVELNATKIVPIISNRTIIHIDEQQLEKKLARWNKIALEAAQQSNRISMCQVEKPIKLNEIVKYKSDINIVPYENEKNIHILELIDSSSVTFVVGPEGGFEEKEIEFLKKNDFVCCSLGNNILRAETAGLYVLAVIDAKRSNL
ncbi:MAG: RsmE family RNA methyltransferase [Erysipelotrichia bacterium]|nr:RsmE family RNA methyltransferase [Erysipelotrichia bacterium]